MLVLDAALTGAKGVNIWSSFRGAPPQRRARLYTTLVERGLASVVVGLAPADAGAVSLQRVADRDATACRSRRSKRPRRRRSSACGRDGLTEDEVARAKRQLRARLVFEADSVTNIAHQIGYFETVTGPGLLRGARVARARGDGRAGRGRRRAPPRARQADGRLVPSAGAQGVTTATSGLSPVRHVLPNGAVVIVQETAFSPAVTISMAFRAGSLNEPDDLTGPGVVPRARHRPRHDHAVGGRDCRGARRSRRRAEGDDEPSRHHAVVHLPVRGLRRRARRRGRRRAQPGVPAGRDREAARRNDHGDPAGPGQPGHPRQRGAAGAPLRSRRTRTAVPRRARSRAWSGSAASTWPRTTPRGSPRRRCSS